MIYKDNFNRLFSILAGEDVKATLAAHDRKRLRRALYALKVQNYFLNLQFTNATGAAGVRGVSITAPLKQQLIIRGGSQNALPFTTVALQSEAGTCDIRLYRSSPSRPQLSREFICDAHYIGGGRRQGQKWSLDWPVPWVIDPNEVIRAEFLQQSATFAGTVYNVGLYGVTVDHSFRCEKTLLESLQEQICRTTPRPLYLNMKNDQGAGSLTFPAIGANQRIVARTDEAEEHLLVLGFRRTVFISGITGGLQFSPYGTVQFLVSGDYSLSRGEIPVAAFELFTTEVEAYFHFAVPYLLQRGSSIGAALTQTTTGLADQFMGEINWCCVTV
jgi:hypothetical protein